MRKIIHHFFSAKGSINRRKYWASHVLLVFCIVGMVLGMIHAESRLGERYTGRYVVAFAIVSLLFYSSLCLHAKRLENIKQAGRQYSKFTDILKPMPNMGIFGCLFVKLYLLFFHDGVCLFLLHRLCVCFPSGAQTILIEKIVKIRS